jgi:hypothetical protein
LAKAFGIFALLCKLARCNIGIAEIGTAVEAGAWCVVHGAMQQRQKYDREIERELSFAKTMPNESLM